MTVERSHVFWLKNVSYRVALSTHLLRGQRYATLAVNLFLYLVFKELICLLTSKHWLQTGGFGESLKFPRPSDS